MEEYVLHMQAELDVLICQAEARGREAAEGMQSVQPSQWHLCIQRASLVGNGGVGGDVIVFKPSKGHHNEL